MPAPIAIAPLAWKAAQLGAIAAISFYAARRHRRQDVVEPRDIWRETALNDLPEGVETEASHNDGEGRLAAAGKFKRGVRIGANGPGIEMEIAAITRFRFRKL